MFKNHIHGYNGDVDTGTEDLWTGGGSFPFPSAAAATKINSGSNNDAAAGTGARTVRIVGLDANYKIVEETATMNGTSDVILTGVYLRILAAYVLTAGSGAVNAGQIDVLQGATVRASIVAGVGRTQMAVFTAPAGAAVYEIRKISLAAVNAVAGAVYGKLYTRKSGGAWQIRSMIAVHGSGNNFSQSEFEAPITLDAGEDVRLEVTSSADNTAVGGQIEIDGGSVSDLLQTM